LLLFTARLKIRLLVTMSLSKIAGSAQRRAAEAYMIAGELADDDASTAENTRLVDEPTMDDARSHTSSITLEDALTYG
jgi:hypothetical protein